MYYSFSMFFMHYHHLLATVRVVPYYLSGSHDAFRPWHKLTIISCYTYVFFCSLLHSCLLSRLPGYDCMNESRYNYPLASYFTYSGQQFFVQGRQHFTHPVLPFHDYRVLYKSFSSWLVSIYSSGTHSY